MRRTRILSTLGPSSETDDAVAALLSAGTDAFRLNFSHGTAAGHGEVAARVRRVAAAAGRAVALMQDLGGPKIRLGRLAQPVVVDAGQDVVVHLGDEAGGGDRIVCGFDALFTSVRPGHRLLINDGRVQLAVREAHPSRVVARVVVGGTLESRKGVNLPDTVIQAPPLTAKDLEDLAAGVAMGVDVVAQSFVQSADDVRFARAAAARAGAADMPIVAKIERPQAVADIDAILDVADGILVARGDLGIEMPLESLPAVQRRLVLAARRRGVPVIVATEVLESMRTEPRPTRAEVTDAAHIVDERADAIMLAGETAVGRHPVRAVQTLDAIIRHAEAAPGEPAPLSRPTSPDSGDGLAVCEAAVALASRAGAAAIVALTEAGRTARTLASLRPPAAIVAVTEQPAVANRLSLVWGVEAVQAAAATIDAARTVLVERGLVQPGAVVVFVAMDPGIGRSDANFVHVGRV